MWLDGSSLYNLAYLHVVDGLEFGFHELGPPMTLAEFRAVFKGTLMGNCGYTMEKAEDAIRRGDADLISFGRPYISNPDLVERFANGWPLNPPADRRSGIRCLWGRWGIPTFPDTGLPAGIRNKGIPTILLASWT